MHQLNDKSEVKYSEYSIIDESTEAKNNSNLNKYEKTEIDVKILIDKLNKRNIQVKDYENRNKENTSLDNLSDFMGNNFNNIKKIYDKLKRFLNRSDAFYLDLKNASQKEISASCLFCNYLYQIAFLSEYNISNHQNMLFMHPQTVFQLQ